MLIEALVLDGDGSVDQILGDILEPDPLAVDGGVDLLQQLDLTAAVHIVDIGGLLHVRDIELIVSRFRKHILFQIVSQNAHKDKAADQHDQQHRHCGADGDFHCRKQGDPDAVENLDDPVRIPVLTGLLGSPSSDIFIFHSNNLRNGMKASCMIPETLKISFPFIWA